MHHRSAPMPAYVGVVALVAAVALLAALVPVTYATDGAAYSAPVKQYRAPAWVYGDDTTWPTSCSSEESEAQSPVDLRAAPIVTNQSLLPVTLEGCRIDELVQTAVENNGRWVEVWIRDAQGSAFRRCTVIDPVGAVGRMRLVRFHFHLRGEHRIAPEWQDAEMHLVFERAAGETRGPPAMVLGVPLHRLGKATEGSQLMDELLVAPGALPLPGEERVTQRNGVNIEALLPGPDRSYLAYNGSLTNPPCTEGIQWVMFTTLQSMSTATYEALWASYNASMPSTFEEWGNARPTQPLNGRRVYQYVDPSARQPQATSLVEGLLQIVAASDANGSLCATAVVLLLGLVLQSRYRSVKKCDETA